MITYGNYEKANTVEFDFSDGAKVHVKGNMYAFYDVYFYNRQTNQLYSRYRIKNNEWCRCTVSFFVDWEVFVFENSKLWAYQDLNLENKNVLITIDSPALGDNIAWIPYIQEFSTLRKCKTFVATAYNSLLEKSYPELEFIPFGIDVINQFTSYKLGLFLSDEGIDSLKHPKDPRSLPMQKLASDILGLEYREIKPKLNYKYRGEYSNTIVIGPHASKQCKFWNHPTGWDDLVNYLKFKKYEVISVSNQPDNYFKNKLPINAHHIVSSSIDDTIEILLDAKLFIGLGSGLSWLSWALNVPTVLISGFSLPYTEMQSCIRIEAPADKCSGCFNKSRLNRGDWYWCPEHKGSEREFECTKSITPDMVIEKIQDII